MINFMNSAATTAIPTILFGAFDRHNLGDLLFPHIAAALLREEHLLFAGLAQRDLRSDGGHEVRALAQVVAEWGDRPVNILHVGGELLTCDAWQAAVMLLSPEQAQEVIAHLDAKPERFKWARSLLRVSALAPYTLSRQLFPRAVSVIYNAVGGVELGTCDAALRAEVLAKLKSADVVSVRDQQTQAVLESAGITAQLIPDPVVMVAELFGEKIHQCAQSGEIAQLLATFPQGYIAVQFSADFGDDETLAEIAAQFDQAAASSGYGVVFFRAGAAPWHDDLACYQRIVARMQTAAVQIVTSLNIWDICAVIALSHAYCGSSLHGRIVAMAFALPCLNLRHPAHTDHPTKQAAFAATWEEEGIPNMVDVHEIALGIDYALAADSGELQRRAGELAALYRHGFAKCLLE